MELSELITRQIKQAVARAKTVTPYREPLVAFASAGDHLFTQMKTIIGPHHLHPVEMLAGAKTVVSFFIPFGEDVIRANRKEREQVDPSWCVAYVETNRLISEICEGLKQALEAQGFKAVAERPTHNFNEVDLTAGWSHKSIAFVAGLGTFGVNRMLITPAGCAGRFGSMVIAAEIPPTPRPAREFCRYYHGKKCLYCVTNCPTGALQVDGLDKQTCYRRLLEVAGQFTGLGLCDVCGKCALGPCATGPA